MRKFTLLISMFVSVLALNAQTLETKFTYYNIVGQVSETTVIGNGTIEVTMPVGASLASLKTQFTLSEGATAKIGDVAQVSGTTVDFSAGSVTYTVTNGESTQNWVVSVKTSGVNEDAQLQAEVYPNPANEALTIDGVDNATVTVVNIIGRQIDRIQINDVTRQVSTASYANGTYLVIIESNGKRAVKKVSVVH